MNVFSPPAPSSLKPGNVDVARSLPVGTGVAPVVARIESVTFGLFVVQLRQKSSTSTSLSLPETVGVNVWPAQLVFVKLNPAGLTVEFCVAVLSDAASWMTPGVLVRSQLVGTPRWNRAW